MQEIVHNIDSCLNALNIILQHDFSLVPTCHS